MPQFKKTKKIKTSEQREWLALFSSVAWQQARPQGKPLGGAKPETHEVLGQRPPHIPARASHAPSSHSEPAVSMHLGKVFGF